MKTTHSSPSAYTLIEILIATSISLILLLGVTELFRNVGGSINDTQATLNMAANLNNVAIRLRSDLSSMTVNINKPVDMANPAKTVSESDGYLEIVEGMNAPYSDILTASTNPGLHVLGTQVFKNPTVSATPEDKTVGDVDDIIMFTAQAPDPGMRFRGRKISGGVAEEDLAEIIWFVRGKTLYRRVLLIGSEPDRKAESYADEDYSVYYDATASKWKRNTLGTLARRENRYAHTKIGTTPTNITNTFPWPLYDNDPNTNTKGWYFLRMPLLEETTHTNWQTQWNTNRKLPTDTSLSINLPTTSNPPGYLSTPYLDLWEEPNGPTGLWASALGPTGALTNYANTNRVGEDIVMTNVISFDVKVWNPYWVPCIDAGTTYWAPPQYVDLGQDRIPDENGDVRTVDYNCSAATLTGAATNHQPAGFGFTLKGRYNASQHGRRTVNDDEGKKELMATSDAFGDVDKRWHQKTNPVPMPCVFDTWTTAYELIDTAAGAPFGPRNVIHDPADSNHDSNRAYDMATWRYPPPYTEEMKGLQITIRCFDPRSGNIRQVRVVHPF